MFLKTLDIRPRLSVSGIWVLGNRWKKIGTLRSNRAQMRSVLTIPLFFLRQQIGSRLFSWKIIRYLAYRKMIPIEVNYQEKVGNEPTGKENPELLKMPASPDHGHNNTIINGIGRIGFMSGGIRARWVDEEITGTFLSVAQNFISENKNNPFFLSFLFLKRTPCSSHASNLLQGKERIGLSR